MAKKDPKELPVEEKLKALFQLQTTLSGIDEKRALRGELPLEVRDLEEKRKDLEANRALLEDRQHALEEKRNELDEIMQETREEEGLLKEKAAELETKIEPGLLRSFKRIRRGARNGLGIVYVQRDACGGCFNKIPPQRQLDVKMHKKIIVCEYCGRILIDPELAGVKVDKTEEKPKKRRATRKKKEEEGE